LPDEDIVEEDMPNLAADPSKATLLEVEDVIEDEVVAASG